MSLRIALVTISLYCSLYCGAVQAQVGCGLGTVTCAVTTSGLSFGSAYAPFSGSPADAVADVDLTCTLVGLLSVCTIPYSIEFDTGGSGSYSAREMSSLGDVLQYNLYTDPARSIVWGDGTGATGTVSGSVDFSALLGAVRTANHPAYGRIPANQAVDEGVYADTLTVTVTY